MWAGKPMTGKPQGIIIHAMGEMINGLPAPQFLQSIELSAHAFVWCDGSSEMGQATNMQAFHAGLSEWKNWKYLNKNFLGIELLIPNITTHPELVRALRERECFSECQYEQAAKICADWVKEFDIDLSNIVGHDMVSHERVRPDPKPDPGKHFRWAHFITLIKQQL